MEFRESPAAAHHGTQGPERSVRSLLAFSTALGVTTATGDQALGAASATVVSILLGTVADSSGIATTAAISAGTAIGTGDIPTALLSLLIVFLAHRGEGRSAG